MGREEIHNRIESIRETLDDRLLILAHHYQRDEVVKHSDFLGDSLALSKEASRTSAEYIVFCGVHFMAETADILTSDDQVVVIPDLNAGCFLADTADITKVDLALREIASLKGKVIPVTYINSSAHLKALCGRNGGIVCTSSNVDRVLNWAFERGETVFFFPDQHLGRNTAYRMGIPIDEIVVWDSNMDSGGLTSEQLEKSKVVLWDGYCNVHMHFSKEYIDILRERYPDIQIVAHPECKFDVAINSDYVGSTEYIIKMVNSGAEGTKWGIGTEFHLVNRLRKNHPDKLILSLQEYEPECGTMALIDEQKLLFILESLNNGKVLNQVRVNSDIKRDALIAINRMLSIS